MSLNDQSGSANGPGIGVEIHSLMAELFPICRSITGDGFRKTLEILGRHIPMAIHEVPSGTCVFDWTVPKEWNIRDAFIKDRKGRRLVDFQRSNLHVVSYSLPIHAILPLAELKKHLHTLPGQPDLVPYKTAYYSEDWGFCLSHRQLLGLEDGDYEVVIDSTLEDGSLTYGESYLNGATEDEILVSVHACHPSLANDNLSGVGLATMLARHLGSVERRYSYRFLFIPGTIGAITWLCLNEGTVGKIKAGLVVAGAGDGGDVTYQKSRRGSAEIDRAAAHVLGRAARPGRLLDFRPYGYDERQYCSPGFDLPVGRFSRTPFGEYPEYHTSGDDMSFVSAGSLTDSFRTILAIFELLEGNRTYRNVNPKGEPQLGRRSLYAAEAEKNLATLWVLNLSDGGNSLLDIAERAALPFESVREAAQILEKAGLLVERTGPDGIKT
jgi:aminopeptidase-like protein